MDQILSAEINGRSANQGKTNNEKHLTHAGLLNCSCWHRILLGSQILSIVNMLEYYRVITVNVVATVLV